MITLFKLSLPRVYATIFLGTIASFGSLGEDCDTTWVVVAEGFLVEEQMISSKLDW